MNLVELRNEVQVRTEDSSLDSNKIDRWIDQGIKQWAGRFDWPSLITSYSGDTTTSGTTEYSLQSEVRKVISMRVGTSETDSTEYSYIDYKNKNVSTNGNYYYIIGNSYGLIPTPSTTGIGIFYKYYEMPSELAEDEHPPFPEIYHELPVFFALKKYWEMSDEFQKSLYYDAEYENMIERMKTDLIVQSTGQLSRMKDIRELVQDNQPQKINSVSLGK